MVPQFSSCPRSRFYRSDEVQKVLSVSMCKDRLGNMFHCVQWVDDDGREVYCTFSHFSSVLDFIESNFK